jgi:hypothetical protein
METDTRTYGFFGDPMYEFVKKNQSGLTVPTKRLLSPRDRANVAGSVSKQQQREREQAEEQAAEQEREAAVADRERRTLYRMNFINEHNNVETVAGFGLGGLAAAITAYSVSNFLPIGPIVSASTIGGLTYEAAAQLGIVDPTQLGMIASLGAAGAFVTDLMMGSPGMTASFAAMGGAAIGAWFGKRVHDFNLKKLKTLGKRQRHYSRVKRRRQGKLRQGRSNRKK